MSLSAARFTIEDLQALLNADPDTDDAQDVVEANIDREFADLGYDSLAVLELASQLRRHYGVHIADDELTDLPTPARLLAHVNRSIADRTVAQGA